MEGISQANESVLDKAFELLSKYPLCDHCLGRAFSNLATGLSDEERGRAVKVALLLELDRRVKDQEVPDLEHLRSILENMISHSERLYEFYFGSSMPKRECFVCRCKFGEMLEELISAVRDKVPKGRRFVIGARVPAWVRERETNLVSEANLAHYEPLKDELKREAGKRLAEAGYMPDPNEPEVEVVYDFETRDVKVTEIRRRHAIAYLKLSRNVPISAWYARGGQSLESELGSLQVPYAEKSQVRVLDEFLLISPKPLKGERMGYVMKDLGELRGKELKTAFSLRPSLRQYRVLHLCGKTSTEVRVYGEICETVITAKDWDEAKGALGLSDEDVIAVDMIKSFGPSARFVDLLVRRLEDKRSR